MTIYTSLDKQYCDLFLLGRILELCKQSTEITLVIPSWTRWAQFSKNYHGTVPISFSVAWTKGCPSLVDKNGECSGAVQVDLCPTSVTSVSYIKKHHSPINTTCMYTHTQEKGYILLKVRHIISLLISNIGDGRGPCLIFSPPFLLLTLVSCWRIAKGDSGGDPCRFIAHGGSSSPTLCISHTDAGGVLYSDQKHPGHQAFPGVSVVDRKMQVLHTPINGNYTQFFSIHIWTIYNIKSFFMV